MTISYRKATLEDLPQVLQVRIDFLRWVNHLGPDADLSPLERQTRAYLERAMEEGSCAIHLAFEGERFVGLGCICFYWVMPSHDNPSGHRGYIMNLYTQPDYRGRGIAHAVMDRLIQEARDRGVNFISLEATVQGRKLYAQYGFVPMEREMELQLDLH